MNQAIKFTIIIPHKNAYKTLIRLLNTIPNDPELEVIIVDNNSENATKEKLKKTNYNENVKIIYDNSSGGAGKARNIGLDNVNGNCKWLLFADADDYFTTDFYELINQYYDDLSDIVYFGAHSVHEENLQKPAQRHIKYMGAIREYLKTPANQDILKYGFRVPWAKIIRRELIEHNNIRFEEVVITNDDFFSLKAGHYAKTLTATLDTIYIVTYAKNNLSSSFTSDKVRYNVKLNVRLRANKFLRSIGKGKYQTSFHFILLASFNFGIKHFFYTIFQFVKYRQNPFIKISGIAQRHLKKFLIKYVIDYMVFFSELKYFLLNKFSKNYGITKKKRKTPLIVSLTSFPQRIERVYLAIETILRQTEKPDYIFLCLSTEEFKGKDLPKKLLDLEKRGLTIKFYKKNLRSHNKLIHTLKENPEANIITVDDDHFYSNKLIKNLYDAHKKFPKKIVCRRARKMLLKSNNRLAKYNSWPRLELKKELKNSLIFPLGVGGVLYPPNSLNKEVFNEKIFLKICPYADDVWFKAMSLLNKTECGYPLNGKRHATIPNSQENALWRINVDGEKNDIQIADVFKKYDLCKELSVK